MKLSAPMQFECALIPMCTFIVYNSILTNKLEDSHFFIYNHFTPHFLPLKVNEYHALAAKP